MWRWEDVKMRRCEDEQLWRCENVWQTPTIRRTLRSDALGKNEGLSMGPCPRRTRVLSRQLGMALFLGSPMTSVMWNKLEVCCENHRCFFCLTMNGDDQRLRIVTRRRNLTKDPSNRSPSSPRNVSWSHLVLIMRIPVFSTSAWKNVRYWEDHGGAASKMENSSSKMSLF